MRQDTTNWIDDILLLSLGNTLKDNLGCSAAERVFGTPLSLPGQYFSTTTDPTPTPTFTQELCQKGASLIYTPPHHRLTDIYISQLLRKSEFVFVRNNDIQRPLTPAYIGRRIKRGDRTDTVSVDHVKPTFLEKSHAPLDFTSEVRHCAQTDPSCSKDLFREKC